MSGGRKGSAARGLNLEAVRAAAEQLAGVANRTTVMTSRELDGITGARVRLKCECFQRTGSFKFRGAYSLMDTLSETERACGVCAVSSGNHAQAVALAARELALRAAVLMPEDAPAAKVAATRAYGAEVVSYNRYSMPQVEAGRRFAADRGATFVPAYDDPRIAAGAGTALLEVAEDGGVPDVLVAPVGGGGGMAGYATVVRALNPAARVIAVESDASAVWNRSLRDGCRVEIPVPRHIADGQMLTTPGAFPFAVLQPILERVVLISDAQIVDAMVFMFERLKLAVEPSGAIAVAALLSGELDLTGRDVAVVVSGANVGIDRFTSLMTQRSDRGL